MTRPDPSRVSAVEPDAASEPLERDPIIERLLPRFVENRRRDVANIVQLLDRNEYQRIAEMGHNLKGTGRSYGHDGISEIGRALEEAASARDASAVRRQADALAGYIRDLTPND